MVNRQGMAHSVRHNLGWKLMTSAAIIVLAAGCTKTSKKKTPHKNLAAINYSQQTKRTALKPNHPLHIATTKWARKHEKNPADATAALNYARNLKTLGAKDKAFEVLARSYQLNRGNGELASEYGRIALDLGKVQMADRLLNEAMRSSGQPDWRLLSAMGTVSAKRGDHKRAQSYYLAALKKRPGATSVYNNLALSYALDGKAGDAEQLLKQAVDKGHNTQIVRQNLALVLGLQSKFEEAQKVAQADLDDSKIDNNVSFLRKMVKKNQIAKAPKTSSVRTARAEAPKVTHTAAVDAATTAALPAKKRAAQIPVATKQTATAPTKRKVAKAPLPSRKPVKPAPKPTAVANAATKKQDAKIAHALPWQTNTKPKPARTNVAALNEKAATTTWSVSVEEAKPAPQAPTEPAPQKKAFSFPDAD